MNKYLRLALPALVASLAACSAVQGDPISYKSKSTAKVQQLDLPPDVAQLFHARGYGVAGTSVTASSYQVGMANAPGQPTAAASVGDVRIERSGSQRWLVVGRTPDELWTPVRDFWQESGFVLTTDQRDHGILETDWAESRAKLPQDLVRGTVGKFIDSDYSAGALDRFRTRLERTPDGTEIYVSHRGMVEVHASGQKDLAQWEVRPADPELEAEFLRRLMVKLGTPRERSNGLAATTAATQNVRVATVNGQPVVQMSDAGDRAWRRVGLALDRTGFTVEDRDRSAGVYFVRYVNPEKKEQSMFSKLLNLGNTTPADAPLKLRISVQSQGESSTVSVQNESGAPDATDNAQRIVQVIADDLK